MKIFTNTSFAIALFAMFSFSSFTTVQPSITDNNGVEPWTQIHNKNGVMVYYDIMDCLDNHQWLCMKIVNNTGQPKKFRFTAKVANPDGSVETFNFIKVLGAYSSEKSDCSKESFASGLVRPLKNATEQSVVSISLEGDN